MIYNSLQHYIKHIEQTGQLLSINSYVSPELEMTEIVDRLSKIHKKAVLFTNNGTDFPVLMNMFFSYQQTLKAIGLNSHDEFEHRLNDLFKIMNLSSANFSERLKMFYKVFQFKYAITKHKKGKGKCFEIKMQKPDINKLPVLKCWPFDGGKFITLPVVHTIDPETGITNAGMYRMQIFDSVTTGMHWHIHKDGASHFEKYKHAEKKMPVVVTLGGPPIYTYVASAPLPEIFNEYVFAGFLRKKRVSLVKCISCDIEIPEEVDFVIEGYINPDEEMRTEGPFGDHTGFYSLPDKYPVFHITHISHRKDAVYPATIVGIPPKEDAYLGKTTERLFLPIIKKIIAPEIIDINLPAEGGFHNLAIVSIDKKYPAHAVKTMNALWGAGQMMFIKNIIIVNKDININDFEEVAKTVISNAVFPKNFHFMYGPLDVLDHANTDFAYGKKMGIDATNNNNSKMFQKWNYKIEHPSIILMETIFENIPLLIIYVNKMKNISLKQLHYDIVQLQKINIPYVIYMEENCFHLNFNEKLWFFLANFNAEKNIFYEKINNQFVVGFDGTMKTTSDENKYSPQPNVITMSDAIINSIDKIWKNLNVGEFIDSPSRKYKKITSSEGYIFS